MLTLVLFAQAVPADPASFAFFERLISLGAPAIYLYFIWTLWKKVEALEAEKTRLIDRYHEALLDNVRQLTLIHEKQEEKD